MFFGSSKYSRMKSEAASLPQIEVTKEEFVRMMIAEGKTESEAAFQAKICGTMGSQVRIGQQMVSIKEE